MHVAFKSELEKSILAVARWVEERDYAAYDPGDGSMSFLRAFAFNNLLLERLLTAVVLRVPFNIRPWIGIKPHISTKGMGYMAWGYLWMHENTGEEAYRRRAVACLEWLAQHRSARSKHFCWGNHFTFVTRNGRIPAHEPTIVWSSLIGQAFLKAYDLLQDARYLEIAASIADWILTLPREKTDRGECLSYVGSFQSSIHNSNMLGAALLAGVARHTGHQEAQRVAREAMTYSCARQLPDGAWYYGEAAKNHWVDSFHTGYNLDSLRRYIDASGDEAFAGELQRGYDYFKNNFFLGDGAPKYFHNQARPIDIQCASQCIDTLAFFSDRDPSALELARRVAQWTISNMQDADGHFYYRDLGWMKIQTPMLHWGQGTMFKALAHLLNVFGGTPKTATETVALPDSAKRPGCTVPNMPANAVKYVLVTAAKNEQAFIEKTLDSVVTQTLLPQKWIIVSDGSTDRTDEIVSGYSRRFPWIELMRMPAKNDRDFSGKAMAFNSGYRRAKQFEHQVVGSLDADLSFPADYFSFLLEKFVSDPELGIAGTPFSEGGETYDYRFSSADYVSGACQLFRRECFEQIGGYVPVKGGGIDVIAVMTARLNGWRTRTFTDKVCIHHRPMSSANHKDRLMASFKLGQRAYRVGFHPLWQLFRSIYQMTRRPYLTGGLALFFGYFSSMARRADRPISRELMEFQRRDQMRRLREFFLRVPGTSR